MYDGRTIYFPDFPLTLFTLSGGKHFLLVCASREVAESTLELRKFTIHGCAWALGHRYRSVDGGFTPRKKEVFHIIPAIYGCGPVAKLWIVFVFS